MQVEILALQEGIDNRRPDWNSVCRKQVMAIRAEWAGGYKLGSPTALSESPVELRRDSGRKKMIVFCIDPQHRDMRALAKLTEGIDQNLRIAHLVAGS